MEVIHRNSASEYILTNFFTAQGDEFSDKGFITNNNNDRFLPTYQLYSLNQLI